MKENKICESELLNLNKIFHEGKLLTGEFYNQLLKEDFVIKKSILISVFPDGGNTYCGQLIRQDGRVFDFDLDLDDSIYTSWSDITDAFMDKIKNESYSKEVVGFNLFLMIKNSF